MNFLGIFLSNLDRSNGALVPPIKILKMQQMLNMKFNNRSEVEFLSEKRSKLFLENQE